MKSCFSILLCGLSLHLFAQKEIRLQNKAEESVNIETTRILRVHLGKDSVWACKNFHISGDTVIFESKYTIDDKTGAVVPNKKDFYVVDVFAKDTLIKLPLKNIMMLECTKKSLEKYYHYRYFNMHRIEPLLLAFIVGGGLAGGISTLIIQGASFPNMAVIGIATSLLAWRIIKVNVICGTKKYYLSEWSIYMNDSGGEKKKR